MSKTTKKYAKKGPPFVAELCSFKHQAIKAINGSDGATIIAKKDSVIALREMEDNGEKFCLALCENGNELIKINGTYQEVAAKLNWVIEDVTT